LALKNDKELFLIKLNSLMKKLLCSILLLVLLTGCVVTKNINLATDDLRNMRGKTIAVVSRDNSNMALKTPLHAAMLGGALVYFDMIRQGNNIVRNNNIEDPSILMAKKLRDDLAKYYNLKIISDLEPKKVSTYNVNKISDLYRGVADYVIDVRTLNWELSYVAIDISNYAIVYSSQLKLIDVANSKVIAENSCSFRPYNKDQKDVILADEAKFLKQELVGASDACSKLLKDTSLGLSNSSIKGSGPNLTNQH
jgi:hypothetical protein